MKFQRERRPKAADCAHPPEGKGAWRAKVDRLLSDKRQLVPLLRHPLGLSRVGGCHLSKNSSTVQKNIQKNESTVQKNIRGFQDVFKKLFRFSKK